MQDTFVEYIISKRNTPKDIALKAGIIILAILLSFVIILFLSSVMPVAFLLTVGVCYGAYYLLTGMNIEYEYSVTNGDIDIDTIIAQRKRKRLLSVNSKNFEKYGKYKREEHLNDNYQRKIFACDHIENPDNWYFTYKDVAKGDTIVVFSPNDRVLNAIKPFLNRLMQIQLDKQSNL